MNTWLHFIGKQYTPVEFTKEAKHYGVSRRVALHVLKRMNWGDRVLLAQKTGSGKQNGKKTPSAQRALVFGMFHIENILGIDGTTLQELGIEVENTVKKHYHVHRVCGSYRVTGTGIIKTSLPEIAQKIEEKGIKLPLMIGGKFQGHENVTIKKMPHFQGFRLFDHEKFQQKLAQWDPAQHPHLKTPQVEGLFYADPTPPSQPDEGMIILVEEYSQENAGKKPASV